MNEVLEQLTQRDIFTCFYAVEEEISYWSVATRQRIGETLFCGQNLGL